MLKKLICFAAGILLAVVELVLLGVSPMTVVSTIVLVAGFVALFMAFYSDYIADRKVTVPMIVSYSAGFIGVALAGIGFTVNRTVWIVLAIVFIVIGFGAALYDKKLSKKK